MKDNQLWRGCFIDESLKDPTILNKQKCYKIWITDDNEVLDEEGNTGRWHMYWIECEEPPTEELKKQMRYNWYGHFWQGDTILAIFENNVFTFNKNDRSTWKEAVEFGKSQGILEEQLDFVTD